MSVGDDIVRRLRLTSVQMRCLSHKVSMESTTYAKMTDDHQWRTVSLVCHSCTAQMGTSECSVYLHDSVC